MVTDVKAQWMLVDVGRGGCGGGGKEKKEQDQR
jgi:hypothetical protein